MPDVLVAFLCAALFGIALASTSGAILLGLRALEERDQRRLYKQNEEEREVESGPPIRFMGNYPGRGG